MDKIWALYKKHREGIDYLFWGGVAFVLYMFLYWIFVDRLKWNESFSTFIDNVIVIIFAFFTNKWFVFRSKSGSVKGFFREFISFGLARVFTMVLSVVLTWVGCDLMGYNAESYHIPFINDAMIVQFIIQVIVIVSNYVLSKLIVFRKPKEKKEIDGTESKEKTE